MLSFMSSASTRGFDCQQIRIGLSRARLGGAEKLGLWSGGIKVRANAGDQSAKGDDDFVESEFLLESSELGERWFWQLKAEMLTIEDLADSVYACTKAFYKRQKAAGKDQAKQASNLFWQRAENPFQALIKACGAKTAESLRPVFAQDALKAYNTYCPKDTARQLDAWAATRPQLGKYFNTKNAFQPSTNS